MRSFLAGCLGALVALGSIAAAQGGAFVPSLDYVLSGQWTFARSSNPICFEGPTDDGFEACLTVTDPTADRVVTIPNTSDATLFLSTLATNAVDIANSIWAASNAFVFEGATADAFETTLSPADPVADATVTLPNVAGALTIQGLIAAGATETLVAATHAGACIALDTLAGSTITLPAATGTGNRYCFVVSVAATSNQHRINVVGNDAFYGGFFGGNDSDNTVVMWPTAADADQINLSGTDTCGFKGARIELIDIVADGWSVMGWSDCSGTEATPFATGQVS